MKIWCRKHCSSGASKKNHDSDPPEMLLRHIICDSYSNDTDHYWPIKTCRYVWHEASQQTFESIVSGSQCFIAMHNKTHSLKQQRCFEGKTWKQKTLSCRNKFSDKCNAENLCSKYYAMCLCRTWTIKKDGVYRFKAFAQKRKKWKLEYTRMNR